MSKKGQTNLPIYRCARGSTSLESFHHHLRNFIPGTSANPVNFQAYLFLMRWNSSRKDAVDGPSVVNSFDSKLLAKFNKLHLDVHQRLFEENTNQPTKEPT